MVEITIVKRHGIRKASPVIASPVTGAAAALYLIAPGRSAIIRKVQYLNACGAGSNLSFGQGLLGAFVAAMPAIVTLNGLDGTLTEQDLPEVEFYYTVALPAITFVSTVAGINVQIEVEEIG